MLGSITGRILLIRPLKTRSGYAARWISAVFPDVNLGHIVLPHVADNPNVRQVGNGERVRRRQRLNSGLIRDFLIRNGPRRGGYNFDDTRRMVGVDPEEFELFLRGLFGQLRCCLRRSGLFPERSSESPRARIACWRG